MPSQVERTEADLADQQLFRVRVKGRHVGGDLIVLEHVQQRGLPGVIQAEEEDLGVLVRQAQVAEGIPEPVHEEHGNWSAVGGNLWPHEKCT